MQALARAVAERLEGSTVAGATLAAPGALERAILRCGEEERCEPPNVTVYPLFMSDGWFVSDELPRRLTKAGAPDARVLPAFGLDPAVHRLCLDRALTATTAPAETTLLLAAHGSPTDRRPSLTTEAAAAYLRAHGGFREVRTGYVDEAPYLADAGRVDNGRALCLPFFASRAGHVEGDLPKALAKAGFPGPTLDPVGTDQDVPRIIAEALMRA